MLFLHERVVLTHLAGLGFALEVGIFSNLHPNRGLQ